MTDSTYQEHDYSALANAWEKYRVYALTSRKRKSELYTWRFRVLILALTGAIVATLSQQTHSMRLVHEWGWVPTLLGVLSAVTLGLAVFFGREIVNPDQERRWIRARSMAEALKSQVYLFLASAPPYNEATGRHKRLLAEVRELLAKVGDMSTENISKEQQREGLPLGPLTIEDYIRDRVDDQIDGFYRPQTMELVGKMKRNRNIGLGLGVLAIVLGALGFTGWTAGWVATISTITASIAAYAYAGRYQYLIVSYQATANKLESLRTDWETSGKTEADAKRFILGCEEVISVENSAWMAELSKVS